MSTDQPTSPWPSPGPPPAADPGATWIADGIVSKVAAEAARGVEGVEGLRGGAMRRGWMRASERRRGGAGVRVQGGAATIDLRLVVRHGVSIPAVVDAVRARVIERVEFATGLSVSRVDIGVVDVVAPPAPEPEPEPAPQPEAATPPEPSDAPGPEAADGPGGPS